jgi:hypothetical protein
LRTVFFWFGALSAAAIVLVIAAIAYMAHIGAGLDRQSKDYATASVVAVTTHWSADALMQIATPALRNSTSSERMAALFGWFATLGPLAGDPACTGSSLVSAVIGQGTKTTANYVCRATYQHGEATIDIFLIKSNNAWRVNGFHVNSPVLVPRSAAQKT